MNDSKKNTGVDKKDLKHSGVEQKPRKASDDDDEDSEGGLKPVRPKIGESDDNLKQRSDWFQKRSGRS